MRCKKLKAGAKSPLLHLEDVARIPDLGSDVLKHLATDFGKKLIEELVTRLKIEIKSALSEARALGYTASPPSSPSTLDV